MVQRREDLGLSLESPQSFRVLGELIRQDLDRHIPAELPVSRPIDLSHPAFADRLEDLVVGEFMTRLERHDPTMLRRWCLVSNHGSVEGRWSTGWDLVPKNGDVLEEIQACQKGTELRSLTQLSATRSQLPDGLRRITSIDSSASRYSSTNSIGTGPNSVVNQSRISLTVRMPLTKFSASYTYWPLLP